MITFVEGNILEASTEAIVNTVNTMGVMGKGIALQFKEAFPENTKAYLKAVKDKEFDLGKVLVVPVNTIQGVSYIINFPTKANWRFPSKIQWIAAGLDDMRNKLIAYNIKSVAIPPLGCGNGGLDWDDVKDLILRKLSGLNIEIQLYQPSAAIREILKKEDKPKAARLTPARAMLLYAFYQYRALGENVCEFAGEKLSYFLQRFGETQFKLDFEKGYYGPYSGKVKHVLYAMNGYYLRGYEQKDNKPFDAIEVVVSKAPEVKDYMSANLSEIQSNRLKKMMQFILGFESPYGLELLATVDFLVNQKKSYDKSIITDELKQWSERKNTLFPAKHIELAINHLQKHLPMDYEIT